MPLLNNHAGVPVCGRITHYNAVIVRAHATGAYSNQQIGEHFGIHFTAVGKMVRWGI